MELIYCIAGFICGWTLHWLRDRKLSRQIQEQIDEVKKEHERISKILKNYRDGLGKGNI